MALSVIGAGFGRTGTHTLKLALEQLGLGPCHHMEEVMAHPEQKAVFEDWVLTAKFHDYPDGWLKLFKEAGYTGDYYWTIIE